MKKVHVIAMLGMINCLIATAQTWPDFYLTNGTHLTSYGVETYDPATAKNLYVNPTAILKPGGTELSDIYDGNQLYLNGGWVVASAIDEDDFTWNSGTLNLNGGNHLTTYGFNTGTGKILNIGPEATLFQETLNSIPSGSLLNLGAGRLSVGDFNASMAGFSLYGYDPFFTGSSGTLEISGTLSGMPSHYYDSGVSVVLNGDTALWDLQADGINTIGRSVTVKNGATLTGSANNWFYSTVTVTGSGSRWDAGTLSMNAEGGEIIISDGGQLHSAAAHIGDVPGSGNKVVVTGNESLWNSGTITMGQSLGFGNSLVVSNGAHILSEGTLIGVPRTGGNHVMVTGKNSQWIMSGGITLGDGSGGNTLIINNGGYVESANAYIGRSSLNVWLADGNKVEVSGEGSAWNNAGLITIGNTLSDASGGNSLEVSGGGLVRADGGVVLVTPYDVLNLNDGGHLTVGTDFDASMVGFNFNSGGTLSVEGQFTGLSQLEPGRRLETPNLLGDFTVHGIFAPGTSPADSLLDGTLTVASDGTLEMELGGYAVGTEYDRLTVTGLASLDGLLDIVFLDNFAATNGASFDLFNWDGGVSGTFSAISTTALETGQYWDTSELYTTGQLSVIPEPGSVGLLGLGSGILLFTRRHRRRRKSVRKEMPGRIKLKASERPHALGSWKQSASNILLSGNSDIWIMSDILDIFKALADEGRLRILRSIDQAELSVAELVSALEMPQSTVSRHLKPMREAGLVASRRDGTSVYYNRGDLFRDASFAQILNERLKDIPVANRDAAAVERVLDLRRRKSREFFDEIAGRYGSLTEPGGGWQALAAGLAAGFAGQTVADLGCGEGALALLLGRFAKKVVAFDQSEKMLKLVSERAAEQNILDKLDLRVGNLESLNLSNEGFDAVFLSQWPRKV
jgi:ArsR family transcriptional regulator